MEERPLPSIEDMRPEEAILWEAINAAGHAAYAQLTAKGHETLSPAAVEIFMEQAAAETLAPFVQKIANTELVRFVLIRALAREAVVTSRVVWRERHEGVLTEATKQ